MKQSSGKYIVIFNLDLWDIEFVTLSLKLMDHYDIVIASKSLARSVDNRPLNRRFLTFNFNLILRKVFGFKGSETHGMKMMKSSKILSIMERCQLEKGLFDTELILRAERRDLRIIEVPTKVKEIRVARDFMLKKIFRVSFNLWRLKVAMWKDMGIY